MRMFEEPARMSVETEVRSAITPVLDPATRIDGFGKPELAKHRSIELPGHAGVGNIHRHVIYLTLAHLASVPRRLHGEYCLRMGRRNYLIEGLSGTGKTSVCDELQRRGYHAIHGDRELAYRGDPETGEPREGSGHEHHIWNVEKVKALVADKSEAATFFCGGSRNFSKFIDLFDEVFVLEVDLSTLHRRLDERPDEEWGGGKPTERDLIVQWHQTKGDVPENGVLIDATAPLGHVVDEILRRCRSGT